MFNAFWIVVIRTECVRFCSRAFSTQKAQQTNSRATSVDKAIAFWATSIYVKDAGSFSPVAETSACKKLFIFDRAENCSRTCFFTAAEWRCFERQTSPVGIIALRSNFVQYPWVLEAELSQVPFGSPYKKKGFLNAHLRSVFVVCFFFNASTQNSAQ